MCVLTHCLHDVSIRWILIPDVFVGVRIRGFNLLYFCSRALGDAGSAATYFEESVEFLSKLPKDDLEVISQLIV